LIEQLKLEKAPEASAASRPMVQSTSRTQAAQVPCQAPSIAHHAHEVSSSRAVIFFLQVWGIYSVKDNQCEQISYFSR
jgi:hypothetical protein